MCIHYGPKKQTRRVNISPLITSGIGYTDMADYRQFKYIIRTYIILTNIYFVGFGYPVKNIHVGLISPRTLMVLILDGDSEIDTHVRSNICYFICLRHLIRSREVTNLKFE